jgi:hypothetical protein
LGAEDPRRGSEDEDVGGGDGPGVEVEKHDWSCTARAIDVEPQRLVRGAEDEAVVGVLREVVGAAPELRGGEWQPRRQPAAEACG